jgi:hypothetical protein
MAEESGSFRDSVGEAATEFDFAIFDCVAGGDFFPFRDGVLAMIASNEI